MTFWKVKIDEEDAKSLKIALDTRKFLYKIKDYAFLCDDLSLFENNNFLRGELEGKKPFEHDLGNFISPDFEISGEVENANYGKALAANMKENLKIIFGSSLNWKYNSNGISFSLVRTNDRQVVLWQGPFPNHERNRYPYTRYKVILELANYFYNRQPLYKAIHKSLLESRKELEEKTNEEFTQDLISLFSVEKVSKDIPFFPINKNSLKSIDVNEYLEDVKNGEDIGFINFYLREGEGDWQTHSQLKLNTTLNNNNEIIFGTEGVSYVIPKNNDFFAKTSDAIENRTSVFLQQIVSSIYFGEAIYNKIKTKLFMAKI